MEPKNQTIFEIKLETPNVLSEAEKKQFMLILSHRIEGFHCEIPENLRGGDLTIKVKR